MYPMGTTQLTQEGFLMKAKLVKRTLSLISVAALLFTLAAQGVNAAGSVDISKYPYVYVHGLFGWGEDEGINNTLPYWGAASCSLMDEMNKRCCESYAASVGPMSSNWDRVCELYAQITGTRVDYGKAHSEKYHHSRYGRTYSEPMIEGWGEPDAEGNIKKINLIGHSFGGATVRTLTALLEYGSAEEQTATDPDDISPLFTGGKGHYINSVTTLCAPHNGTTLAYVIDGMNMAQLGKAACYIYAGLMGRSKLNGYVDFHLEQFGLTPVPGDGLSPEEAFIKAFVTMMSQPDNAADDMYPDRAQEINEFARPVEGVYYFSYSYQTTRRTLVGTQISSAKTLAVLRPMSDLIGMYSKNLVSDYKIDSSWLPNDGLVNVVSARYPFTDAHEDYSVGTELRTGKWYVMPTRKGDHGTVIGMQCTKKQTLSFYRELTELIESLPVTD